MKVIIVTGCYGHVGVYVCENLLDKGFIVLGLDIREYKNHKLQKYPNFIPYRVDLSKKMSIQNFFSVINSTHKVDVLLHIAFIIPPQTKKNPELSYKINVEGSKYLFDTLRDTFPDSHILFTSSIATLQPRLFDDDPVSFPPESATQGSTLYGNHKIEVENHLKSNFEDYSWTICKLASVLIPEKYLHVNKDETAYSREYLPWNTKAQSVHVRNVAIAFTNICSEPSKFDKKVYLLGGRPEDRMIFSEFMASVINRLTGIPEEITKERVEKEYTTSNRYYMHWYDVTQANSDLDYLKYTFHDFLDEIDEKAGLLIKVSKSINKVLFRFSSRYAQWFLRFALQ